MKLKVKILTFFLPCFLGAFFLLGHYHASIATQALEERVSFQVESLASVQAQRLTTLFSREYERLALVSSRTQLRLSIDNWSVQQDPTHLGKVKTILLDARDSIPAFERLTVLDPQGTPLVSTESELPAEDSPALLALKTRMADHPSIHFQKNEAGELQIVLSAPLFLDQRLVGYLDIVSHGDVFLAFAMDQTGIGRTGETTLTLIRDDAPLHFLTPLRFRPEAMLRDTPAEGTPAEIAATTTRLIFEATDYRGQTVIASTRHLPHVSIGLAVKIDKEEALAPMMKIRRAIFVLTLFLAALVTVLTLLLTRQITHPIADLTSSAEQITRGDFGHRAHVSSGETGQLARAFNEMTESLIKERNLLEFRVQERTRDLEFAAVATKQADHTKARLLADMSQDLRASLITIMGYSQCLIDEADGPVTAEQRESLKMISGAGENLMNFVNGIMDLSQIESGKIRLDLESGNLVGIVRSSLESAVPLAVRKGIRLNTDFETNKLVLSMDPAKIRQLVGYLLHTAIEFSQGGEMVIRIFETEDEVGCSVQSNKTPPEPEQPGLSPDTLGMELMLARKLAELHLGHLHTDIREEGTTFTLLLPNDLTLEETSEELRVTTAGETLAPIPRLRSDKVGDPTRVLIVDDDPYVSSIIADMVQATEGYESRACNQPLLVKQDITNWKPDVILLDLVMPQKSGLQLLAELYSDAKTRQIPIIMVSSFNNPEIAKMFGARDYIDQVLSKRELSKRLRPHLDLETKPAVSVIMHDDAMRTLYKKHLKDLASEVHEYLDGRTAIDGLAKHPPNAIFLDLMMPHLDGFEVLGHIRANKSLKTLPVFIIASKEFNELDFTCVKAQGVWFIKKNKLTRNVLIGAIDEVMGA